MMLHNRREIRRPRVMDFDHRRIEWNNRHLRQHFELVIEHLIHAILTDTFSLVKFNTKISTVFSFVTRRCLIETTE